MFVFNGLISNTKNEIQRNAILKRAIVFSSNNAHISLSIFSLYGTIKELLLRYVSPESRTKVFESLALELFK